MNNYKAMKKFIAFFCFNVIIVDGDENEINKNIYKFTNDCSMYDWLW